MNDQYTKAGKMLKLQNLIMFISMLFILSNYAVNAVYENEESQEFSLEGKIALIYVLLLYYKLVLFAEHFIPMT